MAHTNIVAARKSSARAKRRLAAKVDPEGGNCILFGCNRPTQATAGKGFSRTHCLYHVQLKNRHGSYWKRTYSEAHLKPYRAAAARHIRDLSADDDMRGALRGLRDLLNWDGRRVIVPELKQRDVETKARAAIWRLQQAEVDPERLLVNHLAITAAVRDEMAGGEEYRLVQIAKAALRMASGYHKQWSGGSAWHVYPRSRGLMLRVLGEKLDGACGGWVKVNADGVRQGMLAARLAALDLTKPLTE